MTQPNSAAPAFPFSAKPRPLDPERYRIHGVERIPTPAVCVYPEIVAENIDAALRLAAGDPARLRPHVKTHKTAEIARMLLARGVQKHKCATLAEAKLLVDAGVCDILVAYPVVGPNIDRFVNLVCDHPHAAFSVLADHPEPVRALDDRLDAVGRAVEVLVDVDVGMGRTGVPLGPDVVAFHRFLRERRRLRPGGLHVYDGHNEDPDLAERSRIVAGAADALRRVLGELRSAGFPVPRIVVGGSGSFHLWLDLAADLPALEGAPGTFVFSDWNYHQRYPDYGMTPAAVALARVVSKPRPGRLTLDLGHKAVAGDVPAPSRAWFFDLASWSIVRQNEEHLVLDTPDAGGFQPGDVLYAIPYHVCPTVALHRDLWVVENGEIAGQWRVAARDRL
jgi:D-serine deaminase-like pyridoxal phosphate-dependent protein